MQMAWHDGILTEAARASPAALPLTTGCAINSLTSTANCSSTVLIIWHIWDGRKRDGFHALVNYHKLAEGDGKGQAPVLESLTYSYLGDWIAQAERTA